MEGDSEVGAFSSSAAALDNSKVENDNDEIKRCIEDMVERLASGWVDQESTMDAAALPLVESVACEGLGLYERKDLLMTPSVCAGFTEQQELHHRHEAILLIRELQKLYYKVYAIKYHGTSKVPPQGVPPVLATGAYLVHHFAMKVRLQEFPAYQLGAACYVFACMVEGQVFRLKDVLEAANLLCHDRLMKPLRQDSVDRIQKHMYKVFSFDTEFTHPDILVVDIILKLSPKYKGIYQTQSIEDLYNRVLSQANQLLKLCIFSPICLFWSPILIPLGIVGVAFEKIKPNPYWLLPLHRDVGLSCNSHHAGTKTAHQHNPYSDVDFNRVSDVMNEIQLYLNTINQS